MTASMEDAEYPSTVALDAMRTVMRELTLQLALLNSHLPSTSLGAGQEIDLLWWEVLQQQTAQVIAKAATQP